MKNKKLLKKIGIVVLLIIIIQNSFSFYNEYQKHIVNAPIHLREANKDYIVAKMFRNYYSFFIKTFRLDLDNPSLYPFYKPMVYFYKKGLNKLDKSEPLRAMWFHEFELTLYNYSTNGKYGSLAKNYDYKYAKVFIHDVYMYLELINKNKEKLNEYKNLGYKNELTTGLLDVYLQFVQVYVQDYHLNPRGFTMRKENLEKVSESYDLYMKFKNIEEWDKEFIYYYKESQPNEYNIVLNPSRGWHSSYKNYYLNILQYSSFILFYQIANNKFDCIESRKYIQNINISKELLLDMVNKYQESISNKILLNKIISYLNIRNVGSKDFLISENPLKLEINCK